MALKILTEADIANSRGENGGSREKVMSQYGAQTEIDDAAPAEMVGATETNAGAAGLVPAPAAGDNGKFLRGDGTWGEVDIPEGGGGDKWRRIRGETFDGSATNKFEISTDEDENAICLKKVLFVYAAPNISYGAMTVSVKYESGQNTLFTSSSYNDQKNANCPVVGFIDATTPYFTGYIAKTSGYFNQNTYGNLGGARDPRVVSKNITSIVIGVGIGGDHFFGAGCTYEIWGVDA